MKEKLYIALASNIKSYRNKKKLSQRNFADELGLHYRTVQSWEQCKCAPNSISLNKICDVLDVTIEDLLLHDGEATEEEANVTRFMSASTMAQNALKYLNKGDIKAAEKCLHDVITFLSICAASD